MRASRYRRRPDCYDKLRLLEREVIMKQGQAIRHQVVGGRMAVDNIDAAEGG
jgi:hypothetical protein